MDKQYSDQTIKEILSAPVGESDIIDWKMQDAYEKIRKMNKTETVQKKRVIRSIGKGFAALAAVFVLVFTICLANPVWASGLPLIGGIFERIQRLWNFGELSEEEIVSLMTETVSETETEVEKGYPYQASSKGYTFYITEYYATNQGVFLGVRIESEEKLPGFYEPAENNMNILIDWQTLEGIQLDEYTYEGVLRIDMEEVPEQFELDFSIREVWIDYLNEEKTAHNHKTLVLDGCDFKIPIERSDKDLKMIPVNEIGEAGVGMKSVQISPVEVTLNLINTEEEEGLVTYPVVLDAKGRKLEPGSMNSPDVYAIGDSDISTLYVYVCEWDEYMDIKGLALEEDASLFQNALEECALYKKVIDTTEK